MPAKNTHPILKNKPMLWKKLWGRFFSVHPKNEQQLLKTLYKAERYHNIDHEIVAMIKGVLHVANMQVRDIMIPTPQMIRVPYAVQPHTFLPKMIESGHSRFPVVGQSDKIIGLLLAKDLLNYLHTQPKSFNMDTLLRPAIFVPESKRLNILLHEFRINRGHMAIVVDEYGDVAGLVTIEDILELIVGDIKDEYDHKNASSTDYIQCLAENDYLVNALTPLSQFNQHFCSAIHDKDSNTIGGVVAKNFGHLPKKGEKITLFSIRFEVIDANQRRIRLLKVIPPHNDCTV